FIMLSAVSANPITVKWSRLLSEHDVHRILWRLCEFGASFMSWTHLMMRLDHRMI
ncbi:hypothetical protein BDN72DRAFT_845300, partial [Pluteus cervinus]